MAFPRVVARVELQNVRVEIWVNDIPVAMLPQVEAQRTVTLPINQYVIPGMNSLGVMLHAGPLASRADQPWEDAKEAAAYHGDASLKVYVAWFNETQSVIHH